MNRMYYYNKLCATNPKLNKTKKGRKLLMNQAYLCAEDHISIKFINQGKSTYIHKHA